MNRYFIGTTMRKMLIATLLLLGLGTTAHADEKATHPEMWMFDDKPITATSPGKGKPLLKVMGHIYARVFFDRPIQEVFEMTPTQNQLTVYMVLEGDKTGSANDSVKITLPKKSLANKWVDIDVLPDPTQLHGWSDTRHGLYRPFIGNDEKPLKVSGRQQVFIKLTGENERKDKDWRATFIPVDYTGLDTERLTADATKMDTAAKVLQDAENAEIAKGVALPKRGHLHTAALAAKTEKALKHSNPDFVAVKVIVTGDDWAVDRNRLTGIILGRSTDASIVTKNKKDICTLEAGTATQEYVHGKFLTDGGWSSAGGQQQIDCAKAFK